MSGEIRDYLLSHHKSKDYDRCFLFRFRGKKVFICSRCCGWYSSFLLFWVLLFLGVKIFLVNNLFALYFLPMPAIIDWGIHRFRIYHGTNLSRLFTGFLLGFAFANLAYIFLQNPFNINFWEVAISYLIIVAIIYAASD